MASMRGDYYIWDDASGVHIWAADGYDGWDESGWHLNDPGDGTYPVQASHLKDGSNIASGVSVPQEIMDEYVMMRLAQMLQGGIAEAAIDRAVDPHSYGGTNFGGATLRTHAAKLKAALRQVQFEPGEIE